MATDAKIRITKQFEAEAIAVALSPGMSNVGNALVRRMQRIVPKRTWALHDTIKNYGVEVRGTAATVTVGAGGVAPSGRKVDYTLHVERGTSRMAAQPFMRPAMLQTRTSDMLGGGS